MNKYEFIKHCINIYNNYHHLRLGQIVYNEMHTFYPDIANKYNASIFDPFHNDENVIIFINQCFNEIKKKLIIDIII